MYDFKETEGRFYLQEKLFSMSDGQIEGYTWPDKSGAAVIKITKVNKGEGINYETWIAQKKATVLYNKLEIEKLK